MPNSKKVGSYTWVFTVFSIGLIEDFSRNSAIICGCRAFSLFETSTEERKRLLVWVIRRFVYAQARLFRHLGHQHNFWNRSVFLKKYQIPSGSLKESFSGNSVKISDCRTFYSPFRPCPAAGHLDTTFIKTFVPEVIQCS